MAVHFYICVIFSSNFEFRFQFCRILYWVYKKGCSSTLQNTFLSSSLLGDERVCVCTFYYRNGVCMYVRLFVHTIIRECVCSIEFYCKCSRSSSCRYSMLPHSPFSFRKQTLILLYTDTGIYVLYTFMQKLSK